MTASNLLIIGAGGHGKVVADCAAREAKWAVIKFVDERWPDLANVYDWPVVGKFADAFGFKSGATSLFVALGNVSARLAWHERVKAAGGDVATIIHPAATLSPRAQVGRGTVLVAGSIVNIGARIGEACIVNTGATIDHDCELEDGVHVCPGVHLAGNVSIGRSSWIGIGSSVRQGITIGKGCMIGAGAVVINDIPDNTTVVGVPARPISPKPSGL